MNKKDVKGRRIINDISEIPDGMTEEETVKFWDTHAMREELLDATFIPLGAKDTEEVDIYNSSRKTQ